MGKWSVEARIRGKIRNQIRGRQHRFRMGKLIQRIGQIRPRITTDRLIRVVQKVMGSRRRKPRNAVNVARYTNWSRSQISVGQISKVIEEYWYMMPKEFIEERERKKMVRIRKKEDGLKLISFFLFMGIILFYSSGWNKDKCCK